MAFYDVMRREELLPSFLFSGNVAVSREMSVEKKIEFLESLTGQVSNRRSRRWLNDRLLMELNPPLNVEEIRGLFSPPPWGDDVPPSPFSMTNVGEWDKFRSIDMDKETKIINSMNCSTGKRKDLVDTDKVALLAAWRRIDCRTRDALRRSSLWELIEGYEDCVRAFVSSEDREVLVLQVQDPYHRLLLHGVCEFYNLSSVTVTELENAEMIKRTKITKRKKTYSTGLPNFKLSHFLKISKEGCW